MVGMKERPEYGFRTPEEAHATRQEVLESGDEEAIARMHRAMLELPGRLAVTMEDFERLLPALARESAEDKQPLDEYGRPRPTRL